MSASATVALINALIIFFGTWIALSSYFFSYGSSKHKNSIHNGSNQQHVSDANSTGTRNDTAEESEHIFSWTLHVETLRLFGFVAFIIILAIGGVITQASGLDTIQDPTATTIFKLFGFNHACNWIDHNPAKMTAAMLIPFVQFPMMLYSFFFHCRLAKSTTEGKVPIWLLNTSRVVSPYNFITWSQIHLWFVNNPDDTYGFTAHYIPYLLFLTAVATSQIMNIFYLTYTDNMPFGIKPKYAWAYSVIYICLITLNTVIVISTLLGAPVLDTKSNEVAGTVAAVLSSFCAILTIVVTIVMAAKECCNGDTITLGVVKDMMVTTNEYKNNHNKINADGDSESEHFHGCCVELMCNSDFCGNCCFDNRRSQKGTSDTNKPDHNHDTESEHFQDNCR